MGWTFEPGIFQNLRMVIGNERRVERGVPRRKYLRFVLKLSGMSSRCGGLKWRVWVWSEEAFQRGMKGGFRSRAGFPEGEPRAPNRSVSVGGLLDVEEYN